MKSYRVIYSIDGVEHFMNMNHASSKNEASKMVELAARWKDRYCEVEIISVEEVRGR